MHTGAERETEKRQEEEQETFEVNGDDAELCEISSVQDPLTTPLSPVQSESQKRMVQESDVESSQFKLRPVARFETNNHEYPMTSSPNATSVSKFKHSLFLFYLNNVVLTKCANILVCLVLHSQSARTTPASVL